MSDGYEGCSKVAAIQETWDMVLFRTEGMSAEDIADLVLSERHLELFGCDAQAVREIRLLSPTERIDLVLSVVA